MQEKPQPPLLLTQKIRYRLVWNRARRLNRRGEGLIQIEARQGERRRYFTTHCYCRPGEWHDGWLSGTPDDTARNYALRRMVWEVEQVELEYLKRGQRITLFTLAESVRTNVNPAARLRDFAEAILQADDTRSQLTRQNYRTLLNDIDRWHPGTHLTDIDHHWLTRYDARMRERGIAHNTRSSRLRMLRALMNEAARRDLIFCDPFRRFRIEQMEPKHGFLTEHQVAQLEKMKLRGREERVRDLFLLGCYTGLRFSDLRHLRQEHIGPDGWLKMKTQKTGAVVELPVARLFRGKTLRLVEKYQGDIGRLTRQMPSNSDTNRLLRPLLDRVDATRRTTFHTSRHTFATLLGRQGVPMDIIQHMLGHTSARTTAIYNEASQTRRPDIEKALK